MAESGMADAAYVDDHSIPNGAWLLRRIPRCWFYLNENTREWRPSSAAFDDHPNGTPMSVFLSDLLAETGRRPADLLAGHTGFALAMVTAGLARQCRQGVAREPLEQEPAHAVVFGKKTKSVMRAFARGATWVIPPPQLESASPPSR